LEKFLQRFPSPKKGQFKENDENEGGRWVWGYSREGGTKIDRETRRWAPYRARVADGKIGGQLPVNWRYGDLAVSGVAVY